MAKRGKGKRAVSVDALQNTIKKSKNLTNQGLIFEKKSEALIQIEVLLWAELITYDNTTLSEYIHHSPNGGSRGIAEASQFKKMGVKSGFPDLTLPIAKGGYFGLYIELKKDAKEDTSPNQDKWNARLNKQGYLAVICVGYDETTECIKNYMSLTDTVVCG